MLPGRGSRLSSHAGIIVRPEETAQSCNKSQLPGPFSLNPDSLTSKDHKMSSRQERTSVEKSSLPPSSSKPTM